MNYQAAIQALKEIQLVASGEAQVANDDTEGMAWIDRRAQAALKEKNYSDPTPEMLADPEWNAIWEEIKSWDINVPGEYGGYCGATGNHVTAIFKALMNTRTPQPPQS